MIRRSRNTKTPAKRAKKPSKPPKPPREGPALSGPVIRVSVAVVVMLALLGLLYAQRARLLASPACSQTAARVRLVNVPEWVPKPIAVRIATEVQSATITPDGRWRSVFEDALARDIHAKALADPWIAHVDEVAKRPDGGVTIKARYHRPVAMVRSSVLPAMQLVPVSFDGVVLPTTDARLLGVAEFVQIHGVPTAPPMPGEVWQAPQLADGLTLLKMLQGKPYLADITTIDVDTHPEILLNAQRGGQRPTLMRFGRLSVGDDYRVSPARKIAYLDKYYKDNGGRVTGLDQELDLRFETLHVQPYR